MNISKFNSGVAETEKILKHLGLLKMKGIKNINTNGVSDEFKKISQSHAYLDSYKVGIKNFDFDFLLNDDSFFQFSFTQKNKLTQPEVRYSFFQNPFEYKSYQDYLEYLRNLGVITDESTLEIGDIFREEYEQFLNEQHINMSRTAIRFDVDYLNYRPLIHSSSHIHIGHRSNIRIPCDRIITPLKFVLFTLKHTYYYLWKELIESQNPYLLGLLKKSKGLCVNLNKSYWQTAEKFELFIT